MPYVFASLPLIFYVLAVACWHIARKKRMERSELKTHLLVQALRYQQRGHDSNPTEACPQAFRPSQV
jgi:hypothetical protein